MKYLSICSGIEAATCAWHPLGMTPVAFSEIEAFPAAVLTHHYPNTPNWGDMTRHKEWPDADVDVLVGGTPCQSFSVAGLRKGMADPRGNLALVYLAIADQYRPRWLVWENVPGVLSSNGGRDFGAFLGALGQLGYGFAYRVLDAQYFGVAQRRRRVFVVGCLGDWRGAAAVLFEPESLSGNPAPRREAREGAAGRAAQGVALRGRDGGATAELTGEIQSALRCGGGGGDKPHVLHVPTISPALKARDHKGPSSDGDGDGAPLIAHTLRGDGFDASEDGTGRGTPLVPVAHVDVMPTMLNGANTPLGHNARSGHTKDSYIVPVAFAENSRAELRLESGDGSRTGALSTGGGKPGQGVPMIAFNARQDPDHWVDRCGPLDTDGGTQALAQGMAVRRLTPAECARLQGFPDDYLDITYRGKPAADGPKYKALGNSMAVPCMSWIGRRIQLVWRILHETA